MEKPRSKINQKENQIVFWLNAKTHPLEAIYSTAYVFLDRAYVYLDGDPANEMMVSLKGKEKLNKKQLEELEGEFCNELLNYLLRVGIAKRNKKIRDFIVGTALVSALPTEFLTHKSSQKISQIKEDKPSFPSLANARETDDWQKDPLGIAISWEKKYGKKKKKK